MRQVLSLSYPGMRASPSTCRVLNIDCMCRCLWYARGLCLCPFVTTPRGFTSLPTQEVGYSFLGYIATNKQTNKRCNWRAGGQLCGDKTTTKKKLARSRTVGKAIRSEWICSKGFCFEPKGEAARGRRSKVFRVL